MDESRFDRVPKNHARQPGGDLRHAQESAVSHRDGPPHVNAQLPGERGESIASDSSSLFEIDRRQIDAIMLAVPGGAKNVQDIYPLSSLQEGMLFHRLVNEQSDTYVLSIVFELESHDKVEVLVGALQSVIDRHDVLRTAVLWEGLTRPMQVVYRRAPLPVETAILDQGRDPLEQLKQRMRPGPHSTMDVRCAPLMRLQVAIDAHRPQCYALLQVHHLVCDYQSLRVIATEVLACAQGKDRALPESRPYRSYVLQSLTDARIRDAETFFRGNLAHVVEPCAPFGLFDVRGDGSQLEESQEMIDVALAHQVRLQARLSGVSAARLFHSAWALVVARTSGHDDIVFGTVLSAGQQRSGPAQRVMGLSVNTLPLRLQLQGATARELVEQTHSELTELLKYQNTPLTLAQRCSSIVGQAPLFTALMNFRHGAEDSEFAAMNAGAIRVAARGEAWTNYPVTLIVDDLGDAFALTAQADRRIDSRRITGYLRTALQSLVEALARAPQTPALELSVLPPQERDQVISRFNATELPYPREKLIHQLFEEQVELTPHEVAVICAEKHLTYRQLNCRANQLARYLRLRGAGPERFVGLCVERGLDMVVGVLGILKAGSAYVPLDPNYPQQRLEYILNDTAPITVLSQVRAQERLPKGTTLVRLDEDWIEVAKQSATNLGRECAAVCSHSLAYVIYTSGSTGQPKGVAIEHRNAVNLIFWAQSVVPSEVFCETLHSTSMNFDLSVYECFVPLSCGGTLRVVENALAVANARAGVTLVNTVPSAIKGVLDSGNIPPSVRMVNLAGEALKEQLVESIFAHSAVECVCNLYGPSETTTYSTSISMPRETGFNGTIGRPIANTQIYILDAHLQPVPVGIMGEIYIGGAGVARGYLNRAELTAERFVRDPFSVDPRGRMYKTGDLGRWRADGTIEYLGRNDHQVKIRGFRIELGEIEERLLRHVQVKYAVVLAREDVPGVKRLVAYVVPQDSSAAPSVEALREHVTAMLPEYMVPSAFVMLKSVPLTSNGKLDRKALPAPELEAYVSRQYETPQGEVEEALAGIWRSLLGLERVGRHDNFFELGGHSLLVVQMMERLRRVGLSAEVRRVLESPTLAELAGALTSETVERFGVLPNLIPAGCEVITPQMLPLVRLDAQHIERIVQWIPGGATNVQDIYPLAPLQEGILFHHLLSGQVSDAYVVPTLLSVASWQRMEELIAALQAVIDRHDVLRTAVLWEGLPRPVQVVCRQSTLPVEAITLESDRDVTEQINAWMKPERQKMDLRRAPLVRLQIAADPHDERWYALLHMHHIVTDNTSQGVVFSELAAHLEDRGLQLSVPIAYRNHVAQALAYALTHDAEKFFRNNLGDIEESTAPFGLTDVHGDGSRIEEAQEELEPALAYRVRMQARRLGVSAATLFHAAWGLVVAHTSRREDVVFGTVLLGRLQGSAGAQRILGMFINTLPLRVRLQRVGAKELVEQTQRALIELLSHEQASLAVAQHCSGVVGSSPLFTTLLNYRHSTRDAGALWSGASGIRVLASKNTTNYPITLSVDDLGDGFILTAQTDPRIEPSRVTGYLRTTMQSLIEALEQAPMRKALELSILPEHERRQVVTLFNETKAEYPQEKLIHQLFEEQAERTPDLIAAMHGDRCLTYAELNGRANQLAQYLRHKGIGPDKLVGICVERSLEMVVGLLAILKAGGAYVPLDPNYPVERLQYMVQDAAPQVILTQDNVSTVLPEWQAATFALNTTLRGIAGSCGKDLSPSEIGLSSDNLLYVIYTSGSTGRPKGTAMCHRSMVNLIEWHRQTFGSSEGQRVLQFASLSFDVAFQEIFSTLCTGGTLVLLDEWVRRDTRALMALLISQSIGRLFVPPLMLQSLAEHFKATGIGPSSLKDVITAGEQLRISSEITSLFAAMDGCRLHNHYGPTETHVVTAVTLRGESAQWPAFPTIGRPISNTQIYIVDAELQPAPVGVAGEIYIGGANVARGYLKRPELTEQRFLRDPINVDPQGRMYKTGDLGRWLPDGSIEYLGRNDDQVKIRGYRVELGEIEAQLARQRFVREAAVVVREDAVGAKRLVAYVTLRGESNVNGEVLREHLRGTLPDYMVPSAFVFLNTFPLTPSGKLNRRALPPPDIGAYASQDYEAPQGDTEETIAQIWCELLGVERVGRRDNFFDLGGHSLLVLKALYEIEQLLGCSLKVTDVYKCPTIQDLATRIREGAMEDHFVDLSEEALLDNDIAAKPSSQCTSAKAVLMTGGTGFVGRFLLVQLLQDTDAVIYCVVRAASQRQATSRLRNALATWDLWRDEFEPRLVAIPGDLRQPRLGIDEFTYQALAENIDAIYHCATSMNHLETYAMAKPANVESARTLVKLATSRRPKLINYISTLGVFSSSATDTVRVVHEPSPIDHEKHSTSSGYVASKWVAEKIFMKASESGVACNIFRVGLVWADTLQGRYDELQRGYRILKSCLISGWAIKDYRFEMPPTPVDYVARAVVFLAGRHGDGQGIFHISSRNQMPRGVFERCNEVAGMTLKLVPLYDWICHIKRLHSQGISLPVVPLVEFAFSMDRKSFDDYQRRTGYSNIEYDCTQTEWELERAGIVSPVLEDSLLRACVDSMLSRDTELRELIGCKWLSERKQMRKSTSKRIGLLSECVPRDEE